MSRSYLAEVLLMMRFGLVGILATGIHIMTLWLLLSNATMPVLVANSLAFATAFGFSFAGNYLWTFGAPGSPKKVALRFFTISAGAFLLNSVLLSVVLSFHWFEPLIAAIGTAAVIPGVTYLASRCWGFREVNPSPMSNHEKPTNVKFR